MNNKKHSSRIAISVTATLVIIAGGATTHFLANDDPSVPAPPSVRVQPTVSPEPPTEWIRGDKKPLANSADFSNLKNLAISLSYPLYEEGQRTHPAAYTGGGEIDTQLVAEPYKVAKSQARYIALASNSKSPPSELRNFADCGAFVATVIINYLDPDFPGLLVHKQLEYVKKPKNGWKKVSVDGGYNPSNLVPGDIFISNLGSVSNHVFMWLGTVDGHENTIAQAAYAPEGAAYAHLPALRENPIEPKKPDLQGRKYEVWRYVG